MSGKYEEYWLGIDYGYSNSYVGTFMNGGIQIIPNRIGERTTPSVVCFTEENKGKALVGEETLSQNIDNYKNTIYEVKRFIGLSYEDFIENEYDKFFNYEVVNKNGMPKIRIVLNGKENFYSAEEISSLIIKHMVELAEDFIDQDGEGIKIKRAIITVPAHFTEQQRNAVRSAAKMAGIDIPRIINEPTAAALAYGLGHNLVPQNVYSGLNINKTFLNEEGKNGDSGDTPLDIPRFKYKSQENAIVFNLGGGILDVTLLNITKNNEGLIGFEVIATDWDIHLGGRDFDNKLIDFCISEFCKATGNKEENVRKDKISYKRLKNKCENAKKYLDVAKETIINIDIFYGKEDLNTRITRDQFDDLCKDLYQRIEDLLIEVIVSVGKEISDIDEIILVGGSTRMSGVKNLLKRIFGDEKVRDSLDPDEVYAFGATMEAAKMKEKDKNNFNLQDIVAYNLGISVKNKDHVDREKNGDLMYPIIQKYRKIPSSSEKEFYSELSKNSPDLIIKVYEGNNKYINKNTLLGKMKIDDINKLGNIFYIVKFIVDIYRQLTIIVTIDSLGIKKKQVIKNYTKAILDKEKKRIKIFKDNTKTLSAIIASIHCTKQKISESYDTRNKLDNFNDCCQNYEKLILIYNQFAKYNESLYEKIFTYTKELFTYYIEKIKLMGKGDNTISGVITKIKDAMKNLISQIGYVEDLLNMFTEMQQINELKNIYYEIFINYMKLMNSEGLARKDNSTYYAKLYFEREFYSIKKIKDNDILSMNESNRKKFQLEKSKNEEELKKLNSFSLIIEKKSKKVNFYTEKLDLL